MKSKPKEFCKQREDERDQMAGSSEEEALRSALGETANSVDDEVLKYLAAVFAESEDVPSESELLVDFGVASSASDASSIAHDIAYKLSLHQQSSDLSNTNSNTHNSNTSQSAQRTPTKIGSLTKSEAGDYKAPTGAIAAIENQQSVASASTASRGKHHKRKTDASTNQEEQGNNATLKPKIVRNQGMSASQDIKLNDCGLTVAGQTLVEDGQELVLAHSRRIGFIGENGSGKSTLLRAIASGDIPGLHPNLNVFLIQQEAEASETPAIDAVLECDTERSALLAEAEQLSPESTKASAGADKGVATDDDSSSKRLAEVYARLQEIGAEEQHARAAKILYGLGFDRELQQTPTRLLSGGNRMRVAIARALFVQPSLLLQDEVTNHLDLPALIWLSSYLTQLNSTQVIVSHDREFLNAVCTDTVFLKSKRLEQYRGNYDEAREARNARKHELQKQQEAQNRRKKQMESFINKFRANAKRASLVQSRLKALEKMEVIEGLEDDEEYKFSFPGASVDLPEPVISLSAVSFAYPGQKQYVFENLDFGIHLDSRVGLLGANGCGKSTLIKLVSGQLEPSSGFLRVEPKLNIAVFQQHHVDQMDLNDSPLQKMKADYPSSTEQSIRAHLGRFGLSGERALREIKTLSGGQRTRLALASCTFSSSVGFIILDEPTNHLSMQSQDALIAGLTEFEGGVLFISHDEHFVKALSNELWVIEECTVKRVDSFEQYKQQICAERL